MAEQADPKPVPRVIKSRPVKTQQGGYGVTFVKVGLTRAHKEHMLELNWPIEKLIDNFVMLAEQGYKVSLSPDGKHNSYIATAVGKEAGAANQGKGLTGRGPDAIEAIRSLLYKHLVICDAGAWESPAESDDLSGYG